MECTGAPEERGSAEVTRASEGLSGVHRAPLEERGSAEVKRAFEGLSGMHLGSQGQSVSEGLSGEHRLP